MLNEAEKITDDLNDLNKKSDIFETKINESIATIQNQKTDNLSKKRGRPRKYNADGTLIGSENQKIEQEKTPTPDISKFLTAPLIGISKIPAAKYSCPEMSLTPDEAVAIAESLNGVLNAFFPNFEDIDPKMMSLFILGTTCSSIAMSKVMIYQEKQAEKMQKTEVFETKITESPKDNQDAPPTGPISAHDYFKRP